MSDAYIRIGEHAWPVHPPRRTVTWAVIWIRRRSGRWRVHSYHCSKAAALKEARTHPIPPSAYLEPREVFRTVPDKPKEQDLGLSGQPRKRINFRRA